jgi:hypothetical protein
VDLLLRVCITFLFCTPRRVTPPPFLFCNEITLWVILLQEKKRGGARKEKKRKVIEAPEHPFTLYPPLLKK